VAGGFQHFIEIALEVAVDAFFEFHQLDALSSRFGMNRTERFYQSLYELWINSRLNIYP
jgi:hypothetical protein